MPKLSADALKARIADLQKQLKQAERKKAPAIKKVLSLMRKLGISLDDLRASSTASAPKKRGRPSKTVTTTTKPKKTKGKRTARSVAIKYRDEKGNTWTGRGKTPRWLAEAELQGKSRDQFKV